MALTRIRWGGK